MVVAHIDAATAAEIKAERAALFADAKLLGTVESITFWRDSNEDGISQPFGPFEVLRVRGGTPGQRQGRRKEGQASALMESDGEFRSDDPNFDVQRNDTFELPSGVTGRITLTQTDVGAYVYAPFILEA